MRTVIQGAPILKLRRAYRLQPGESPRAWEQRINDAKRRNRERMARGECPFKMLAEVDEEGYPILTGWFCRIEDSPAYKARMRAERAAAREPERAKRRAERKLIREASRKARLSWSKKERDKRRAARNRALKEAAKIANGGALPRKRRKPLHPRDYVKRLHDPVLQAAREAARVERAKARLEARYKRRRARMGEWKTRKQKYADKKRMGNIARRMANRHKKALVDAEVKMARKKLAALSLRMRVWKIMTGDAAMEALPKEKAPKTKAKKKPINHGKISYSFVPREKWTRVDRSELPK
jgi:hypothetical protein